MKQNRIDFYFDKIQQMATEIELDMQHKAEQGEKIQLTGTEFEEVVYQGLKDIGMDPDYISHSPQKFPDFIITLPETDQRIGLEVKKTDATKWEVIGGSVYESLRNDLDETYVIMAKLGGEKPEVRVKLYKECISDLKVTHSPRFYLDLDLEKGQDFLTTRQSEDLPELTGENLNKRIRQLLRTNKSTWWSEAETTAFSNLSVEEKHSYFVEGVVRFPEVFAGNYERFTPWLIYTCLVWCKNVRDVFSAGGSHQLPGMYDCWVSAIMYRAALSADEIAKTIDSLSDDEVEQFWGIKLIHEVDKKYLWADLIKKHLRLSKEVINKNKQLKTFACFTDEQISQNLIEFYYLYMLRVIR